MMEPLMKTKRELAKVELKLRDSALSDERRNELLEEIKRLRTIIFDMRLSERMESPEYQTKINELEERRRRK